MKIWRLVFRRGIWLFVLSLLLLVICTLLQWSTSTSDFQNGIVYFIYTWQFHMWLCGLSLITGVLGLTRYIITKQSESNRRAVQLFFIGAVIQIFYTVLLPPISLGLIHEDTVQSGDYTYNLAWHRPSEVSDWRIKHILYQCDRWGVVCDHIYSTLYDYLPSAHLQTDPTAHTVSLMLDDEVVYTHYTGE